jgi:hypothetical protein
MASMSKEFLQKAIVPSFHYSNIPFVSEANYAPYLSTRAIFLLYQFINADVERLKIR